MVMDPSFGGFSDGIHSGTQRGPVVFVDGNLVGDGPGLGQPFFVDHKFRGSRFLPQFSPQLPPPPPTSSGVASTASVSPEEDSQEDCDFSDAVLQYINQILMEEDMEDKTCMLQDSLDLQAAERSFYEVLGKRYPPSPNQKSENPDDNFSGFYSTYAGSSHSSSSVYITDPTYPSEFYTSQKQNFPFNGAASSSLSSLNGSSIGALEGLLESPISNPNLPYMYGIGNAQLTSQFNKGVEEASKFLPSSEGLFDSLGVDEFSNQDIEDWNTDAAVTVENDERQSSSNVSRGKKKLHSGDVELEEEEERSSKQAAVYPDSIVRTQMFDKVLLCNGGKALSELREALRNEGCKSIQQNGPSKGSSKSSKGRGKKPTAKKEVDLRTLLILCAQALAADDRKTGDELLKQIRQNSSPFGDGNQRLAHCFADGLEARLAGTGSQIYKSLIKKRTSAADILKAYYLYCAVCPFIRLSHFFSRKTIISAAVPSNTQRVHVIDFGILYGFQWPTFIQRLSHRPGGPPKLRITGIDFPQPGFRPAERVEETGRRLACYAESFKVPFEYNAIAKKWDSITIEELELERDELLIVNCLYRFEHLHDESVAVNSTRNNVLNFIREINPDIFILGILNGAFSAPFFVTRFREALFHFSAMFDMLEATVPREDWERMLIEKEILGREALNVIACEGWERVERPETYKQWQIRSMRAGFVQLPLNKETMQRVREKLRTDYHKDFVIDQDNQWMLQGWKGRIIYALSSWKPA